MTKIYDVAAFPNPIRVRIALKEKGLFDQVEFETVDVMQGEHRTDAFRKLNPTVTVPVLELEDGTTITESSSIIYYLDALSGDSVLTGRSPKERAVVDTINRRAEALVLNAVADYFHHATDGLGPDLETYQNKDWGLNQREKALRGFAYFNELLADNEFVAGDTFTSADITLYAGLAFADFAKIDTPSELTNLIAWRQRVAKRESVQG